MVYPDLGTPEYLKVIVHGDATHASLPGGASQGTQIVKLERMTKTPMISEAMAFAESADAGHFVALMTKEIFGLNSSPKSVPQNR